MNRIKPSQFHPNRQAHNWLAYDVGDHYLEKYSPYYRGKLYDLGCGEAPFKPYFLQYCDTYTGVDWSETLHDSKADVVSDLNKKIDLPDGVADTIVSISVMEHLCEPQVFLNESHRILADTGVMVLQVPWMWRVHEAPYDYYRYSPYGLRYMFKKAGFSDVEVEATTGLFSIIALKLNYLSLGYIRGSRLQRRLTRALFMPFWYLSQKIAPRLDSLYSDWEPETQGYFVVAKK